MANSSNNYTKRLTQEELKIIVNVKAYAKSNWGLELKTSDVIHSALILLGKFGLETLGKKKVMEAKK